MVKNLFVTDLFKMYCEDRHEEDRIMTGSTNYNEMQDVFANTELFDITMLNDGDVEDKRINLNAESIDDEGMVIKNELFKEIALPFSNNFVKSYEFKGSTINVFVREFNPTTITGALWVLFNSEYTKIEMPINMPFFIDTEEGTFTIYSTLFKVLKDKTDLEQMQRIINKAISSALHTIDRICNLPKHTVISDTPKSSVYYPKKKASGIRVTNRPIYYIFPKDEEVKKQGIKRIKPIGHLEYTHSFKVRGHWRRINQHSLGKNRNGEYKVYGYTFVKEYVKGEGELVKRVRVLKS